MSPTDLTVAAVVQHAGKFLLVEEYAYGRRVFSLPGGHIEAEESPEQAVARETIEETGCTIDCDDMIGVYLWIQPQTRQQFLRIAYAANFVNCDESLPLDDGIIERHWMSLQDLRDRQHDLRSPAVLRCTEDYIAGRRQSDTLLTGMLPLQQNVHKILATANLV